MTTSSTAPAMSRRPRRQPQRSCVACGAQRDKRDLLRLARVADEDGAHVVIDEPARAGGRGAYLCAEATCWTRAIEGPALARAFRGALTAHDRDTLNTFASRRFAGEHAR